MLNLGDCVCGRACIDGCPSQHARYAEGRGACEPTDLFTWPLIHNDLTYVLCFHSLSDLPHVVYRSFVDLSLASFSSLSL